MQKDQLHLASNGMFGEVDSLDKSLFAAARRIRRVLKDPAVSTRGQALISLTFQRSDLEALAMLLDFMNVPDAGDEEYLPLDHRGTFVN